MPWTATSEAGETYAEVAHEAVFRRWAKRHDWIAAEREFLAWRTGIQAARRAWQATPDSSKADALAMGAALTQAQSWLAKRREDLPAIDQDFIDQSARQESKLKAQERRARALVRVLLLSIIAGLIAWINQPYLKEQWKWYSKVKPYIRKDIKPHLLTSEKERALEWDKPFKECENYCPTMVFIPAGEFKMGSPESETGRRADEGPQHVVTIVMRVSARYC
jgi:formylglycine-generating enzyme required for sulfatase activity